jgi:hypothetical protein
MRTTEHRASKTFRNNKKAKAKSCFSFPKKMNHVHQVLLFLLLVLRAVKADDNGEDGYYNAFDVCADSLIVVDQISLLCDSPGTYYYGGSGKYRNSARCQGGDKAKLKIEIYVAAAMEATAYLTVYIKGYGSVQDVYIHTNEDICAISSLRSVNGMSPCASDGEHAEVGYYYFQEQFYWGSQDDAYEYSFLPKVVIGITSDPAKNVYDLGGANSEYCSGNTFTKWTTGVGKSVSNTLRTFLITFGLLMGTIISILWAGCYITKANRRKIGDEEVLIDQDLIDQDKENERKIAMVGKNRDLVDY